MWIILRAILISKASFLSHRRFGQGVLAAPNCRTQAFQPITSVLTIQSCLFPNISLIDVQFVSLADQVTVLIMLFPFRMSVGSLPLPVVPHNTLNTPNLSPSVFFPIHLFFYLTHVVTIAFQTAFLSNPTGRCHELS